jgi:GrpB-like predicted nucleotidyltransferase (UPF0157 family)
LSSSAAPIRGKRLQLCLHDREWLETFEVERERITAALGSRLFHIEHVGSTSVPSLLAKPVVDIAIAVGSATEADFCIEPLRALWYEYRGPHGDDERRRYYVLERVGRRMAQIHLWILPAAGWDRMLRFREVLQSNAAVREAYACEKLRIAEMVDWDKAAYSLAKGSFIESILERYGL